MRASWRGARQDEAPPPSGRPLFSQCAIRLLDAFSRILPNERIETDAPKPLTN